MLVAKIACVRRKSVQSMIRACRMGFLDRTIGSACFCPAVLAIITFIVIFTILIGVVDVLAHLHHLHIYVKKASRQPRITCKNLVIHILS